MLFWIVLSAVAGAVLFIAGGFFAAKTKVAKKKEERETDFWVVLAALSIVVGVICFWRSLDAVYKTTIGKAVTPGNLDKSFHRALGLVENLKREKFVVVQNALEVVSLVKSDSQPLRGQFVRPNMGPTGWDLQIIDPNKP